MSERPAPAINIVEFLSGQFGLVTVISTIQVWNPPRDSSRRARETLALIAKALKNTEIAERLVVNPNAVRNHVSYVLNKLGLIRPSEAAAFTAIRGTFGDDRSGR